jgi:hypothetical protein
MKKTWNFLWPAFGLETFLVLPIMIQNDFDWALLFAVVFALVLVGFCIRDGWHHGVLTDDERFYLKGTERTKAKKRNSRKVKE